MESHSMCCFSEFFIIANTHIYNTHRHNCPKIKEWLTPEEIMNKNNGLEFGH